MTKLFTAAILVALMASPVLANGNRGSLTSAPANAYGASAGGSETGYPANEYYSQRGSW